MIDEFLALKRNKTWSIVFRLDGRKAIGCKWILRLKKILLGQLKSIKLG